MAALYLSSAELYYHVTCLVLSVVSLKTALARCLGVAARYLSSAELYHHVTCPVLSRASTLATCCFHAQHNGQLWGRARLAQPDAPGLNLDPGRCPQPRSPPQQFPPSSPQPPTPPRCFLLGPYPSAGSSTSSATQETNIRRKHQTLHLVLYQGHSGS